MRLGETSIKEDGSGRKRKHIIVRCDNCNKLFPKPKRFVGRSKRNCCSKNCAHTAQLERVEVNCAVCGILISRPISKSEPKHGLHFCCREHKEQAQTLESGLLRCGHYKNGIRTYRTKGLKMHGKICAFCDNKIEMILEVHHIDFNRSNNKISNLIVLCLNCHRLTHRNVISIVDRKPIIKDKKLQKLILESFGAVVKSGITRLLQGLVLGS